MKFCTRSSKGISLVIVLGSLVLLSALVVAFLVQMTTELRTSKIYAQGASARVLAQSAANIVADRIDEATAGVNSNGQPLAWVSQPGMIITYDNRGAEVTRYRLYSSDAMTGPSLPIPDSGTNAWNRRRALYTDLNEPVMAGNHAHFPIIDGNNLVDGATLTPPVPAVKPDPAATYLTYNAPSPADAEADVEGFYTERPPSYDSSRAISPSNNPVPMPARWLYVLANGEVVAPDSNTEEIAGSDVSPIIGRIAFWTDDETCKVNINTAAEGAQVWDVPRFLSDIDRGTLGKRQPAKNEYQRYPGHPATVSLSAVFPKLRAAGSYPENIFPITPRTSEGGSTGGTLVATSSLPLKTERLYSTVDEFLFKPRKESGERAGNDPVISPALLASSRFFLSATSRAPDINLFNLPRVSIWPVSSLSDNLPHRSPFDQLSAFCATTSSGSNLRAYCFQRAYPNDPTADLPLNGSTTGLGRNRMLLEYLRRLTSREIPGFRGRFDAKYSATDVIPGSGVTGTERDQILTQIFDYIRSTNTIDQSLKDPVTNLNQVTPYTAALSPDNNRFFSAGAGQVVPILDESNGTRGFGRFPTVNQAALIFFPTADNGTSANQMQAAFVLQLFDPSMGYPWNYAYYDLEVTGLNTFTWDGAAPMWTDSTVTIRSPYNGNYNLEPMTGGVIGWQRLAVNNHGSYVLNNGASPGQLFSRKYPQTPAAGSTFASQGITGIRFTGGPITIAIRQKNPDGSQGKIVQSISMEVPNAPAAGFPLPALSTNSAAGYGPAWSKDWFVRFSRVSANNGGYGTVLGDNDVIRSIISNPGDARLTAARSTIPDSSEFFAKHPRWDRTDRKAHALRTSSGSTYHGTSYVSNAGGGRLVPLSYRLWSSAPYTSNGESAGMSWMAPPDSDVPTSAGVALGKKTGFATGDIPGDWDNGIGNLRDGSYINKADEGDNSTNPYFYIFGQKSVGETFFSPNRMVPSAVMFGSLPSGVLANRPWQTLLFRPGPARHPGLGLPVNTPVGPPYTTPPDHLLLDLFTMPVVEPYAISEPLSTAGRINMNYKIEPYTHIHRETGMRAALKSTRVITVPDADASVYKLNSATAPPANTHVYRLPVNADDTLSQFRARFDSGGLFRSASEICSIDLVPSDYTGSTASPGSPLWRANLDRYWIGTSWTATNGHKLTGDNSRERPYANLYPLLTTKSNTFTIHMRAQSLKKSRGSASLRWEEGSDQVTGEYRGSQTIERFIDPNSDIPDYADPSDSRAGTPISRYYRFRVVSDKQFSP